MLDNCRYNTIKILHELSSLCWFLEKHAIPDAKNSSDEACKKMLEDVKSDLNKHIETLNKLVKK